MTRAVKFATDQPAYGQKRASNELRTLGVVAPQFRHLWAAAKLYTNEKPITAADLLNDCVLPSLENFGIS